MPQLVDLERNFKAFFFGAMVGDGPIGALPKNLSNELALSFFSVYAFVIPAKAGIQGPRHTNSGVQGEPLMDSRFRGNNDVFLPCSSGSGEQAGSAALHQSLP